MARARTGGGALAIRLFVSLLLGCALFLAVVNAFNEIQISRLARLHARSSAERDFAASAIFFPQTVGLPARAALLSAAILARSARQAPDRQRAGLRELAFVFLDEAEAKRPRWAQATLVRVYMNAADSRGRGQVPELLALSYRQAPFLAKDGEWRFRASLANWSALDRDTQFASAQEAAYLASLSYPMSVHIRLLTKGRPIEALFKQTRAAEF